jgi:hypothetical protein
MATTDELREQIIELLLKFEPETEDEECPFDAFLLQAKHYAEYARRAVAEAKRIRKRLREDAMFAELEQIRADDVMGMLKPNKEVVVEVVGLLPYEMDMSEAPDFSKRATGEASLEAALAVPEGGLVNRYILLWEPRMLPESKWAVAQMVEWKGGARYACTYALNDATFALDLMELRPAHFKLVRSDASDGYLNMLKSKVL